MLPLSLWKEEASERADGVCRAGVQATIMVNNSSRLEKTNEESAAEMRADLQHVNKVAITTV